MSEPVLVIHGVANRDEKEFNSRVKNLSSKLGPSWECIPIFWGDLGAKEEDIIDTLPDVREIPAIPLDAKHIQSFFKGREDTPQVRSQDYQLELILHGVKAVSGSGSTPVRSTSTPDAISDVLQKELSKTRVVKYIEDPQVLEGIGHIIGRVVIDGMSSGRAEANGNVAVRKGPPSSSSNPYSKQNVLKETKAKTRAVVKELDTLLGKTLDNVVGVANLWVREHAKTGFVRFFGDILVYQHNQQIIHQRIWKKIAENAPGYGTEQQPIHVIAHSVGGVVAFDAAIRNQEPLWINAFVTFGSQSSFFHVLNPRKGLNLYTHDVPVTLPPTIRKWVNLWEPMDFLAFTAGSIFRLHDGLPPLDIPVYSQASSIMKEKGLTHSIYWETEELLTALQAAFGV